LEVNTLIRRAVN